MNDFKIVSKGHSGWILHIPHDPKYPGLGFRVGSHGSMVYQADAGFLVLTTEWLSFRAFRLQHHTGDGRAHVPRESVLIGLIEGLGFREMEST